MAQFPVPTVPHDNSQDSDADIEIGLGRHHSHTDQEGEPNSEEEMNNHLQQLLSAAISRGTSSANDGEEASIRVQQPLDAAIDDGTSKGNAEEEEEETSIRMRQLLDAAIARDTTRREEQHGATQVQKKTSTPEGRPATRSQGCKLAWNRTMNPTNPVINEGNQ